MDSFDRLANAERRSLESGYVTLIAISMLLYAASLTQPAFFWGAQSHSSGPSWRLLTQGWRSIPAGYVEWLANPLLWLSWIAGLRNRRGQAFVYACICMALMLVFLGRHSLSGADGRTVESIAAYGRGYWLWLGSAAAMLATRARW